MTRRILLSFLSLTMLVLLGLEIPLAFTYASDESQTVQRLYEREAAVLADLAEAQIRLEQSASLPFLAMEYSRLADGPVVIVDADGRPLASAPLTAATQLTAEEQRDVRTALSGKRVTSVVHSTMIDGDAFSIAMPAASGSTVLGAVHMTVPAEGVAEVVGHVVVALVLGALGILLLAALVGFALARWTTRPIRALEKATDRLAAGVLDTPAATNLGPPELRQLAATFNHTAKRLQLLIDQQRGFAADASHQLRTPLTALRLRLENLEPDLAAGGLANLDAAITEIDRLAAMVEQLLALARLEESGVTPAPTDLDAIIAGRCAHWSPLAESAGVHLSVAGTPPGEVIALPGALEQIIDNLLANALRVSPRGGTITIYRHRWSRPGQAAAVGDVELRVLDQGPGMSPEQRKEALNRFWRAPGAGKGGSGLGLAIVARLVQASDAHIALRDAPGGGLDAVVALRPARSAASRTGLRRVRQGERERTPAASAR
jgi:signal transduction histidine kinase